MALHKKEEVICLELGDKDGLQVSYGNQAGILEDWGQMEDAMGLLKKQEAICLELGDQDGLQRSYGNQAMFLVKQGQLTQALPLFQECESICIALGLKRDLGYCYGQWSNLEAARYHRVAQKQKLQQALALFTELNMPRERDRAQSELDQLNSAEPPAKS
ncbi:MAG TPA: hypothetical protein VII23_05305 [Terriglobales bacterium]